MTSLENIRDVFASLHDGTISGYSVEKNILTLSIDCKYLAEFIDKSFDTFFVDIIDIEMLFLTTWPNPFDQPVETLTEPKDIFKAELEILSADIKENKVVISCNQHDTSFDYCGGNLTINCETIKVYDQNKNELTIYKLDQLCKNYWDKFSKK